MIYNSAEDWMRAPQKRVVLFGMSGLGKTYLSNMLRETGEWFHYSVDYRIGTRYMGELIADNAKAHAMQVPFLRDLLLSDSIYIGSNITFDNLAPLSTYLGKPGNPELGGLSFDTYRTRQEEHRLAEISALLDAERFAARAEQLYGYPHFVCDCGGSICEVVDPEDDSDPVLDTLSDLGLMIWLKGDESHREALIKRFDRAPKPMYYQAEFLLKAWDDYRAETGLAEDHVNPDDFVRWTYARALDHRQPRYEAMARRGITLSMEDMSHVEDAQSFDAIVAKALDDRP
ncbi:ATPase [Pseudooceanicola sp. MF1-13]|uniref:ATPase n=1 Tax=Pseudooceanicola sp. MF1-13 TaxID=3379095 RepID=UPI003892ABFC